MDGETPDAARLWDELRAQLADDEPVAEQGVAGAYGCLERRPRSSPTARGMRRPRPAGPPRHNTHPAADRPPG